MERTAAGVMVALLLVAACAGGGSGEADTSTCVPAECAAACLAAGRAEGVCVGDLCQCSGILDAGAETADADSSADADAEADAETEADAEAEAETEDPCSRFDLAQVPGEYAGTFLGALDYGGLLFPLGGDVTFTMEGGGSPGHWTFDGRMEGTAMGGLYVWSSGVQGTADCETLSGLFYDGTVDVDGTTYHFEGTMTSSFEPYVFPDGTFEGACTDCPDPVTGNGTWNATHL
ncbi:MAG: hypothetical protein HY907_13520 [Deltaproteobacteria bacterium]|nr:hypothetical protein [Deltaproteobacteria bacterium]